MNNPQPNQMSHEDAKASLGIANKLQEMLLPNGQAQTPSQTPNPDQGVPQNQQTSEDVKSQMQGLESRLMDELQTLRTEMKSQPDSAKELADFKKQIETILTSNE